MSSQIGTVQSASRRASRSTGGVFVDRGGPDPLYLLHPRAIWGFLRTQPLSFWFINAYLLFEYVRPQSIYEALAGPPWAQISILLALGALLFEGKMFRMRTPVDGAITVFSLVLLLSCVLADRPAISYGLLSEYVAWFLIYLLISNIVTTERRFLVFMLAFILYNFKMSQHASRSWAGAGFAFRDWGATGAPGWFHNSGEFGIEMNVFLPIVIYFLIGLKPNWGWKMNALFGGIILSAVTGTIGSSSRGAMLGMAVVGLFLFAKTKHKLKGSIVLIAFAAFSYLLLPEESLDRFRSMGEDGTSVARKVYWAAGLDAMREHPLFGIGYGNWSAYMNQRYEEMGLPHNIFIQAGTELGYAGLLALLGLIVATFVVNRRTRQMLRPLKDHGRFLSSMAHGLDGALVGFMVSGSFITVLYYPFLWINLAMTVALYNAAAHTVRSTGSTQPTRTLRSRRSFAARPGTVPR